MNQEKFGKLIKEIRKKNNLTQKDLGDKYNVSYQAVSKWENGKNMPDTLLIKQIASDFNISLDNIFEGKYEKKKKKILFIIFPIILIIVILLTIFLINKKSSFISSTISTSCDSFNLSGSISYNDTKTAIYIYDISYCGDSKEIYKSIDCSLYETNDDVNKKISVCNYKDNENITLNDFLKNVTITVNDYKATCKGYSENNLYLEINVLDENNETITYKIPIKLDENCK